MRDRKCVSSFKYLRSFNDIKRFASHLAKTITFALSDQTNKLYQCCRRPRQGMHPNCSVQIGQIYYIDNPYFEGMVNQIYPPELKLNKANTSDTEAPFMDLPLVSI